MNQNSTVEYLDRLAGAWSDWALASSWQIALLVVLVTLVALASRRLSARFRYLLWTLVLIKALMPPTLGMPWSIGNWAGPDLWPHSRATVSGHFDAPESPAFDFSSRPVVEIDRGSVEPPLLERAIDRPENTSNTSAWSMRALALAVWLAGFAVFTLFIAVRYWRLTHALKRAAVVDEGPLRVTLERLAMRMGWGEPPELLLSGAVGSPFLFGLLRPRIVLPESLPETLEPGRLEDVLLHELTHWRRRDLAASWLQILVQSLFWFHPLVWLAGAQLRHERECACDEAVLASGCSQARRYGESLLSVLMAARGRSSTVLGFLGIFERNTRLQRRLEEIMNQENKVRRLGVGGWLALALFAALCLPMAAQETAQTTKSLQMTKSETEKTRLNEDQEAYLGWTEERFAEALDQSQFASLTAGQKDVLERKWLATLEGPENQDYYEAINGLVAIGSKKATPALLKVAAERREKDNKYRWMATRALGLIGDELAVPDLIHLTYHYNQNTRIWAQISLVRLTGQNFGADWQKWGQWWNAQGGEPAINKEVPVKWATSPEALPYMSPQKQREADAGIAEKIKPRKQQNEVSTETRVYRTGPQWERPFVNDPDALGHWTAVDFVKDISQFSPDGKQWKGDLYVKEMDFLPGGKTKHSWQSWTRGWLWHSGDKAEGKYEIQNINGRAYLFMEWISGDVTERGMKPAYYVFVKTGDLSKSSQVKTSTPPRIVATSPEVGATGVDPATTEITVTFDRDMGGGMSWTGGGADFPPAPEGARATWIDKRTCVWPVKLETGRYYRIGINSTSYQNFSSVDGVPARPSAIYFCTTGASPELEAKVIKPRIVAMDPPNGATDVDPGLKELRVTFSVPMGSGFSWTGGGPNYPKGREGERPRWSEDGKTCIRPVSLEPGKIYRLGLNSPSHKNFTSRGGVPLDPVVYTFQTRL